MGLTKALSGEVEPHPCRSPPTGSDSRFCLYSAGIRFFVWAQCSQKHPAFVTYSNSCKTTKKRLQSCRSGVVYSRDAGLRPLHERSTTAWHEKISPRSTRWCSAPSRRKCGTIGSTPIRTTRSGSVIIHADGWAGCMLFFPPFYCLMAATALLFIPDLIRLPSERRRYRWK